MKKLLIGLAVLPFLAGVSLAGQPQALTDQQMDKVSAGFDFAELDVNNVGTTMIGINFGPADGCPLNGCYLSIKGTQYPSGVNSFQLFAQFGPLVVD